MNKAIILSLISIVAAAGATDAAAQRWAIKGYDNISLGKAMSITEAQPGQTSKSSANSFGLDFGYTFWRSGLNSLEVNVGVGYSFSTATFQLPAMNYHYAAGPEADEDGNSYVRYYELSNLKQKSTVGYFNVPIYLEYQIKPLRWLGIWAQAGVNLGFRTSNKVGTTTGTAYAYGIFPEYDDLLIDEPYLDDFGTRDLVGARKGDMPVKGFAASVLCGAGLEFYAYEPVSFVVGVRYQAGLTQVFNGGYDVKQPGDYSADSAPVTYTVADGTVVRSLADYTTKSRFSPFSLHLGINVRF